MGHPARCTEPSVWHHVMIRGIARRSIFDGEADATAFTCRVIRSVERGDLSICAYCLMPNHAHLIVCSRAGRLGDAMRDIGGMYVRGFNLPRERPGPLFQGRYKAIPIRSRRYMSAAVAYTDQNPVEAGLVTCPADYPHGSARHYAQVSGPSWLDRTWVEDYLRTGLDDGQYSPATYARVFGTRTQAAARRWFAAGMERSQPDDLTLDALIAASPQHILDWMDERARSADGTARISLRPARPVADATTVIEIVDALPPAARERALGEGSRARLAGQVLKAGLLRHLAALTHTEIAKQLGRSDTAGKRALKEHDRLLAGDDAFRALVGQASRAILDACHPPEANYRADTSPQE